MHENSILKIFPGALSPPVVNSVIRALKRSLHLGVTEGCRNSSAGFLKFIIFSFLTEISVPRGAIATEHRNLFPHGTLWLCLRKALLTSSLCLQLSQMPRPERQMRARSGLIPELCPRDFCGHGRAGIWLARSGLSDEFIIRSRSLDGNWSCLVTLRESVRLGAVIISNIAL